LLHLGCEITKADEIFIASSYKDLVPIVKIDERAVGLGVVGKNTKILMEKFSELTNR